ncbi:MAG: hypothetical protein AVDCRST_MAG49-4111, partial [uncultured Thermomicrobiales bacterium]
VVSSRGREPQGSVPFDVAAGDGGVHGPGAAGRRAGPGRPTRWPPRPSSRARGPGIRLGPTHDRLLGLDLV